MKAAEEEEKRRRCFKAHDIPHYVSHPKAAPAHEPKLTIPEPFELQSLERHEEATQKFAADIAQELRKMREQSQFKHRELPRTFYVPYEAIPSEREPTMPEPFNLQTDVRSNIWEDFNSRRKEMEEHRKKEEEEQAKLRAVSVKNLQCPYEWRNQDVAPTNRKLKWRSSASTVNN